MTEKSESTVFAEYSQNASNLKLIEKYAQSPLHCLAATELWQKHVCQDSIHPAYLCKIINKNLSRQELIDELSAHGALRSTAEFPVFNEKHNSVENLAFLHFANSGYVTGQKSIEQFVATVSRFESVDEFHNYVNMMDNPEQILPLVF